MTCPSGKQILDKKGAITLKNLSMKLHHIEMREYPCPQCNCWHLATVGRHEKFRHNLNRRRLR